jgi:hypothetical protein
MKSTLRLIFGLGLVVGLTTAKAVIITHSANDLVTAGTPVSPPFGPLAPGGTVGTAATAFGVDYSFGGVEGIFHDGGGVHGLAGVNGSGILDLVSPTDGRIVVLSTTTPGLTSYLKAEAGLSGNGSLTLEAFDINGVLLASVVNGLPVGPAGRTTFTIDRLGVYDIASFRISGADTHGVNQIWIEAPVAANGVPDSSPLVLLVAGMFLIGARRFLRTNKVS